jgi:hypothetical protein
MDIHAAHGWSGEHPHLPHRARLVWRDLVTATAPIAHTIDGYIADQGQQTGDVAAAGSGHHTE